MRAVLCQNPSQYNAQTHHYNVVNANKLNHQGYENGLEKVQIITARS